MGGFCFIIAVSCSEKTNAMRILKTGPVPLNLPPSKSKRQKPRIWHIMNRTSSINEVADCGVDGLGSIPCGRTST